MKSNMLEPNIRTFVETISDLKLIATMGTQAAVSYTHLDVYKRQQQGAGPDQQQANPLQESLGKLVLLLRQLGQQNQAIQQETQQAASILIQALQKVSHCLLYTSRCV